MAVVNNRLEEFSVSILTFIWQERIYCSVCYICEWNRMVYSCLIGCGATEKVPSMKMKKVWALANVSKLLVSRRLIFCFLHSGRCRIAGTVGCCCVLLRQSDICIGGWDLRSWTLVSKLCVWGFLHGATRLGHCRHTGTQPRQRSGVGCQVFHGISGF